MKILTSRPSVLIRGFTLIEVLVVVAIIGALAAMTYGGLSLAQQRSHRTETTVRIKAIDEWLNRYFQDNGEFPIPANPTLQAEFHGSEWPSGGAACLYQALTADGTDQLLGWKPRPGEQEGPSKGEIGSSGGIIYIEGKGGSNKSWFKSSDKLWVVLDAFGSPFNYKPVNRREPEQKLHNTTFDLWSYGTLKSPDDSAEAQGKWVTNWGKD